MKSSSSPEPGHVFPEQNVSIRGFYATGQAVSLIEACQPDFPLIDVLLPLYE